MRTRILPVLAAAALTTALAACGTAAAPAPAPAATHASKAQAEAAAKSAAKLNAEISACTARKPSGQLYVRVSETGLQTQASELGGEWNWDHVPGQCDSALEWTVATAGQGPGECTTIGFVADNPGYDANAIPAAPLPDPDAEDGPGC